MAEMTEEPNLAPYGTALTKRLVVPQAEDQLYRRYTTDSEHHFVTFIDYMGGDQMIERVATAGHGITIFKEKPEQVDFFKHLITQSILTPFKSVIFRFHIQSSIADALHIVYDSRASVNEYSGRYSVMIDTAFTPSVEYLASRMQIEDSQNGGVDSTANRKRAEQAHDLIQTHRATNYERYAFLVSDDVALARELARTPLELNNDTAFFWKIDLYSLVRFIQEKRAFVGNKTNPLHSYLDRFEAIARAVAPLAADVLFRGQGKELALSQPDSDSIIDPTPLPPAWQPQLTKRLVVPEAEEILFTPQPYLEHGAIQLTDYMGGDVTPAETARISYGAGTTRVSQDKHLIRYLLRHRHTTPFEHPEFSVEGKVPVFVDPRQAGRHRTLDSHCFMGQTLVGSDYFLPAERELKFQDRLNRQGRGEMLPESLQRRALDSLEESFKAQLDLASMLRHLGVDEDIIQGTKGVGFYTFQYRTGDLHNWLHFLGLRLDAHAQEEIRAYAQICAGFLERLFPTTYQGFQDYFIQAVTFTRQELEFLSERIGLAFKDFDLDNPQAYPHVFSTPVRKKDEQSAQQRTFNRIGNELRAKLQYLLKFRKEDLD